MIDYARVAQLLKEVDSFIDTADAPRLHSEYVEALTAASALCEAHAAPVDEEKERAEFEKRASASGYDITHHESGDYVERDTNEACVWWLNRARSDARAKVAEKEAENTRLRAECERLLSCVNEAEIGWATDNTEKDDEIERLRAENETIKSKLPSTRQLCNEAYEGDPTLNTWGNQFRR